MSKASRSKNKSINNNDYTKKNRREITGSRTLTSKRLLRLMKTAQKHRKNAYLSRHQKDLTSSACLQRLIIRPQRNKIITNNKKKESSINFNQRNINKRIKRHQ